MVKIIHIDVFYLTPSFIELYSNYPNYKKIVKLWKNYPELFTNYEKVIELFGTILNYSVTIYGYSE